MRLSVCLCVCKAVIYESLDLESSFLICTYIFRFFEASLYMKVESRSRSQEQKDVLCILFAGCQPSSERQSCYSVHICVFIAVSNIYFILMHCAVVMCDKLLMLPVYHTSHHRSCFAVVQRTNNNVVL